MARFISFIFVLLLWISAMPAHAQGAPEKTWCAVLLGGGGGCGFSSPGAVCSAVMQSFYPQDTDILRNVNVSDSDSGTSVVCETDARTIRERGRLWLGNSGGFQRCEEGILSGGQCSRLAQGVANSCVNGGSPASSGNPIDLLSGIKVQSVQDFVTADGRFSFDRSYASRSYGTLNNNAYGILGRGWSVENLPRMTARTGGASLFLPNHQALSVACTTSNCLTRPASVVVAGAPRAQLDVDDPRFTFGTPVQDTFRQPQSFIPFVDQGGVKYIFKSEEYDEDLYYALRRVEYPGGYSMEYETRLLTETITNQDVTDTITPVRFIVTRITDSFGRSMLFDYDRETWINEDLEPRMIALDGDFQEFPTTVGLLKRVVLPDLSTLHFRYESVTDFGQEWNLSERLKSVYRTPPDVVNGEPTAVTIDGEPNPFQIILSRETYHYENNDLPFALTGITDSANVRYATWEYSVDGLAISSQHAGGVDRYEFEYDFWPHSDRNKSLKP